MYPSRAITEGSNLILSIDLMYNFYGYKWVTESKGCKYGCEYAVVCEPPAMDDEESNMDLYV